MAASRATYLRWFALGMIVLAAELSVALVAIRVAPPSPTTLVAGSMPSPVARPTASAVAGSAPPSPSASPSAGLPNGLSARSWAAAAFFPPSGKVVLFGGQTGIVNGSPHASGETWTWDGLNWRQLHPLNNPPARMAAGLVYDAVGKVLVLYGGNDGKGFANFTDTWTWDGTNWRQMSPLETPASWQYAAMTYDATRRAVLLYVGGSDCHSGNCPNDTWSWDGATWTQLTTTAPTQQFPNNATIAYDAASAQTIFVGSTGTWVLDSIGWRRLSGGGTVIGEDRYGYNAFAISDDEARGVLVEVGVNGDTWAWNGKTWTNLNPSVSPSHRSGETLVYDPILKQVVLFGGAVSDPGGGVGPIFGDTWVWDGVSWKQLS